MPEASQKQGQRPEVSTQARRCAQSLEVRAQSTNRESRAQRSKRGALPDDAPQSAQPKAQRPEHGVLPNGSFTSQSSSLEARAGCIARRCTPQRRAHNPETRSVVSCLGSGLRGASCGNAPRSGLCALGLGLQGAKIVYKMFVNEYTENSPGR